MDEYIKRKDAIAKPFRFYWQGGALSNPVVSVKSLKALPAADVVPVRHGKWDCFIDFVTCSLCGYTSTDRDNHGDPVSLNYCPNCGAKMEV